MISAVQPPGRWKILVIDSNSLRILTAVCKMHDILEESVTCMSLDASFYVIRR